MNANDKLSDDSIADAIRLERLKRQTLGRILSILKESDKDITAQIAVAGLTEFQARRINQLSEGIRDTLRATYVAIEADASQASLSAVQTAIDQGAKRLDTVVGVAWSVKPSIDVIYSAAMARPYQGKLMREYYRDLPDSIASLVKAQIRMGYIQGETVNKVVARVNRVLKGKQINFNRTIINTTLAHFAGFAQQRLYERNADSLEGIKWNATLDTRTSDFCIANGGKIFPVDAVPVYPAHFNERTVLTPVVKGADQLSFDVPNRTQASLDGQIPADITNIQWLDRQSFKRQSEALGRTRAELLRDSNLSVADLFNGNKLLTITEIRRKLDKPSAKIAA